MTFAVVTQVPPANDLGNLATGIGQVFLDPQATGGRWEDEHRSVGDASGNPMLDLYIQVPVFKLGELLILNANGRDQFGRKPSKWDIRCEAFDNIDDAVACVDRVITASDLAWQLSQRKDGHEDA